jgi:hypothetical protein
VHYGCQILCTLVAKSCAFLIAKSCALFFAAYNYHQLKGECLALLNVIWNTNDIRLVSDSFEWLMESFRQLPTEFGEANHNLLFSFIGLFVRTPSSFNQLHWKIIYSLKECNCEPSIIEWFESNGADACLLKSEDEWRYVIKKIMETDCRSVDQINQLLEQGHSTDYDRIALRVKIVSEGYAGGDCLTMIIRRVMTRMNLI